MTPTVRLMLDSHLLSLLFLGFLLGIRHALDADHVVAILTIATENQSVWRSSLIGFCWGVGHTLILLMVGAGVLLFKVTIPSAWEKAFEAGVGVMLLGLGVSVAVTLSPSSPRRRGPSPRRAPRRGGRVARRSADCSRWSARRTRRPRSAAPSRTSAAPRRTSPSSSRR